MTDALEECGAGPVSPRSRCSSEELETQNDGETDRVSTAIATDNIARALTGTDAPVTSKVEHDSVDEGVEETQTSPDGVSTNEDGTTHDGDGELLRGWRSSTLKDEEVSSPIDYSQLDDNETPYEHGFLPGDHIIRWDMVGVNRLS